MQIMIASLPASDADRAAWPEHGTPCPQCGFPMGTLGNKMARTSTGEVVHRRCLSSLPAERRRPLRRVR